MRASWGAVEPRDQAEPSDLGQHLQCALSEPEWEVGWEVKGREASRKRVRRKACSD